MVQVERSVTINRTRDEVYDCWRDLDNLPRLFDRVEEVEYVAVGRTHWSVRGPGGVSIKWDAEITVERPGDVLAWRSLEGADVHNEGRIEFRDAPPGRGTEMRVVVTYEPPAGALGTLVAKMTGNDPKHYLRETLRRFKQVAETGEVLLSDGRPQGAGADAVHPAQPAEPKVPS